MMFFIVDSAERLGFTQVFAEIEPKSPQGRKIKRAVQAFLPGDEELFQQMSIRLKIWLEILKKTEIYQEVRPLLEQLKNIDGIIKRLKEGIDLDEGELFSIKANLVITRQIWRKLADLAPEEFLERSAELSQVLRLDPILQLKPLDFLWSLLNPGEVESERFYLRDEYSPDLAEVRRKQDHLQREIRRLRKAALAGLEESLGRTIPFSGQIAISIGDEELLEFLRSRDDIRFERSTFSVNYFCWIPGPAIAEKEEELNYLKQREEEISRQVLHKLSRQLFNYAGELASNQKSLGELDWMLVKAEFAQKNDCVPPELSATNQIIITRGRHLLVEAEVIDRGFDYTPIDINLQMGVTLITGSNMGGKTVNLRMVGLLVALAQHGLYVPAELMRFSLRRFVYFSVDDDQTKGDLSTFAQEIIGLNQALPYKDEGGLILIDELARGTNPEEAGALGVGVIKYLKDAPTITMVTTHFPVLTNVVGTKHLKVIGLNQTKYELLQQRYNSLAEKVSWEIINRLMDYRLQEVKAGEAMTQDALRVASLLGLSQQIIQDAVDELQANVKKKGC